MRAEFRGSRPKYDILYRLVQGRDYVKAKRIAANTFERFLEDGTRIVRYHDTDIITEYPDGRTMLRNGGWYTRTTKERICNHSKFSVCQDRNEWFVHMGRGCNSEAPVFYDGITFDKNGRLLTEDMTPASVKARRVRDQISFFVHRINSYRITDIFSKKLPMPKTKAALKKRINSYGDVDSNLIQVALQFKGISREHLLIARITESGKEIRLLKNATRAYLKSRLLAEYKEAA